MPVTRADELDALAERVEKLTGADRRLDIEIAKALGLMGPYANWPEGSYLPPDACCFTSSLDAAMSLLGDNAIEQFSWWPRAPQEHQSEICCRVRLMGIQPDGWGNFTRRAEAKAATPALALTAACLRAQASIIREAGRE